MAAVKTQRSGPMVQLLIARGHLATSKNRYGWTALDFAKQVCLPHYPYTRRQNLFHLDEIVRYTARTDIDLCGNRLRMPRLWRSSTTKR